MTSPKWLTPAEMKAWRGFIEVVGRLNIDLEADLSAFGLTLGDYQVLVYLSESPDHRMRMIDLAEMLVLSPSGLTRRLDGLVKAGYVARSKCTEDKRVMWAELTDPGFRRLQEIAPSHVKSVRRHFIDRLDATQVESIGEIFEALRPAND